MSNDGKWIGTLDRATEKPRFQLWKLPARVAGEVSSVRAWNCPPTEVLALSHDGTLAAGCSGSDGKVWVYDTETGKEVRTIEVPDKLRFLAFLPTGNGLVAGGKAGVVHVWDARTGKSLAPTGGHLGGVRAVAYTPDGGAVTASADGTAKLWDKAGKEVRTFTGHVGSVRALVLSTDGKTLFTGGADGTVRAWDVSKGTELRTFGGTHPVNPVECLALSADGKSLAVGSTRGAIRVLNADTLALSRSLAAEGTAALVFNGDRLVARDAAHTIQLWDVPKGQKLEKAIAFGGSAHAVPLAVSSDGKTTASALGDEKGKPGTPAVDVGLWDTTTGALRARLQVGRRENEVTAVAFLPGGKAVAVGDSAGIVWVIDLDSKAALHTFKGHRGPVLSLAVAPDGKTLASGGADTTVLVWKLDKP